MKVLFLLCVLVCATFALETEINMFFAGMIPETGCCGQGGEDAAPTPQLPSGNTLDNIIYNNLLKCSVNPNFQQVFQEELCKAVAHVMGVDYSLTEVEGNERFESVSFGETHVGFSGATATFSRTLIGNGVEWSTSTLNYEPVGVVVKPDHVGEVLTVCAVSKEQATTAVLLEAHYETVIAEFENSEEARAEFEKPDSRCQGVGGVLMANYANANGFVLYADGHAFDAIKAVLPHNDLYFSTIVNGVLNGLQAAWALGLTKDNVDNGFDPEATSNPAEAWKLLGRDPADPDNLQWQTPRIVGLPNDFVAETVRLVGNYGDVLSLLIGEPAGLNRLVQDGGALSGGARIL